MKNKIIHGQVIPFNQSNIDTDAIIPKQYLKSIKKSGFGPFLFDSLRYLDPGDLSTKAKRKINPEFILNKAPYSSGNIILAIEYIYNFYGFLHYLWSDAISRQ